MPDLLELWDRLTELNKFLANLSDNLEQHDKDIEKLYAEVNRILLTLQQVLGKLDHYHADVRRYDAAIEQLKTDHAREIADLKDNQRLERENMMLRIGMMFANFEKRLPPPED